MIEKKRTLVACLDVKDGSVVKGVKFQEVQPILDPVEAGLKYVAAGIDELVYYDISATNEGRKMLLEPARELAKKAGIPFTVGGGIASLEDIEEVFQLGVDKVSINSAAVKDPELIREAAKRYGKSRIMVAIDGKKVGPGKWNVYLKGGTLDTGIDVVEWATRLEILGAGELCMNSIDEDGVQAGYDLELIDKLSQVLTIPIIASGGAGKMKDFADAFRAGASKALAASVFHYGTVSIPELKAYLQEELD